MEKIEKNLHLGQLGERLHRVVLAMEVVAVLEELFLLVVVSLQ